MNQVNTVTIGTEEYMRLMFMKRAAEEKSCILRTLKPHPFTQSIEIISNDLALKELGESHKNQKEYIIYLEAENRKLKSKKWYSIFKIS